MSNLEKWIAALRSGEYKQGIGVLYITNESGEESYCAAGVGCKVLGLKVTDRRLARGWRETPVIYGQHPLWELANMTGLPYGVVEEVVYRNDSRNHDFNQLADYLEHFRK